MANRTEIEIFVQNAGESASHFRQALQKGLDEVNARPDTIAPAMIMPTSDSSGRMTVVMQWIKGKEMAAPVKPSAVAPTAGKPKTITPAKGKAKVKGK